MLIANSNDVDKQAINSLLINIIEIREATKHVAPLIILIFFVMFNYNL